MRNTADLRKGIRFILEWHLRYFVGRQAYNTCSNSPVLALRFFFACFAFFSFGYFPFAIHFPWVVLIVVH